MSRGRLIPPSERKNHVQRVAQKNQQLNILKKGGIGRDRISINIPKGKKEEYKAHAAKRGKSLSRLIMDLLEDDMEISGKE